MRIACEFHWEMGHRIPEHVGLCRNVHGHSYRMRVSVDGDVQPSGMVMDFFDMKATIQPLIDSWDHAFMCDDSDTPMIGFFRQNPLKVVRVSFATTVENLTVHVLELLKSRFADTPGLHSITVRIEETEASFAESTVVLKG